MIASRPFHSGEREAEPHLVVAEAGDAVLAPAIGAGAGLVVGKAVPGVAVRAVVLANGAPLALAEVGPPLPPRDAVLAGLTQALLLMSDGTLIHHDVPPSCSRARSRRGKVSAPLPLATADR